jgi:hypothetical protein
MPAKPVKLTARCLDLLRLLRAARWLTTGQVHRRFFHKVAIDAARKRLRKLEQGRYVVRYQENQMSESLWSLGREGQRVLEKHEVQEIVLERRPPKQLGHFVGINDLRIAAELLSELRYFFACWELPAAGWRYQIIPDAVMAVGSRTFALEFDRGQEGLRFFVQTKIETYTRGCVGLPLSALLVIADRETRMRSLMKGIGLTRLRVLFSTIELIKNEGLDSQVFYTSDGERISLLEPVVSKCLDDKRDF